MPIDDHAMRFVPARAQNGSANREDARQCVFLQADAAVFRQAAKSIAETDDLHPVETDRGFADSADCRV